jgi:hypothetical protein
MHPPAAPVRDMHARISVVCFQMPLPFGERLAGHFFLKNIHPVVLPTQNYVRTDYA